MVSIVLTPEQVVSVLAQNGGAAPPVIPPAPPAPPSPPVPPPFTPPGGGSVINLYLDWNNPGRVTTPMGPDDVIVAQFTTGDLDSADNNLPRLSGAEWGSSPSARYAALSDTPGDFSAKLGNGAVSAGNSVQVPFAVGSGNNFGYYPRLQKNTTYFFNIKNMDGPQSCKVSGSCGMFVELSKPSGV